MRRSDTEAYLRCAGDCLRMAKHEPDPSKRGLFMLIAQAWVELADQADARSRSDDEDHHRQAPPAILH